MTSATTAPLSVIRIADPRVIRIADPHVIRFGDPTRIPYAGPSHLGLSVDAVTRRLRSAGSADGTFLGPADRLGETILRDACTLHARGVDRHALAERLESLLERQDAAPLQVVRAGVTCGHPQDPFHLGDVYALHRRGGADYQIGDPTKPAPNSIRFGDLLVETIRRACLFEGNVRYRLDPDLAVTVLGVSPDRATMRAGVWSWLTTRLRGS